MKLNHFIPGKPQQLNSLKAEKGIKDSKLYLPSKALVAAVNVALDTGMPLLLTGEPGTGKTQLAYYLADHYGLGRPKVYDVRTTSTAKDLFYSYDSLAHFQYIQNQKNASLSPEEIETRFIRYNALGLAIKLKKRCIVLIDEIDKAPRDLPNDILAAIENMKFEVPEIGKVHELAFRSEIESRPVVIFTSNSEKNLPDPFLRRCVYFHIDFPSSEELCKILALKTTRILKPEQLILSNHFESIRALVKLKKPATAEFVYWSFILKEMAFPIEKLKGLLDNDLTDSTEKLDDAEKETLKNSYTILAKNRQDLQLLINSVDQDS